MAQRKTLVRDVMTADVLATEPGTALQEAARLMANRRVGAIIVLEGGSLAGIMTERDVLRAVATGIEPDAVVSKWMTRTPETIESDDTTAHAAVLMDHGGFRHLPVVDGGRVVGILSIRDILRTRVDDEAPRGV
jgi:CBS domain-containing protein